MNSCFKNISALTSVLLLWIATCFPAFAENATGPAPGLKEYRSPQAEGLIGVTEDIPLDNPADNIFHVTVEAPLCGGETAWLVYDLDGVQDHTAVSRSINDQVAVGGYLVKRRRGWATQRERIHASWLKQGDNVIRFTMPEHAVYNYRIRNLRIEVGAAQDEQSGTEIVFNQPSLNYYFDKAYIKGLVAGMNDEILSIKVEGKEARLFNGEFEAVVDFTTARETCSIEVEAVHTDGTTTCHAVAFAEPLSPDFTYAPEGLTIRSEQYIDARKEATLSLNGATLHHIAGALKESETLSITSLRAVDIPALDGGMVNVTKNHAGFRFLPHGTRFSKEVGIRIPYDPEKIPDGYTEKDIRTYYFDEQSHHWVALPLDTVLAQAGEVVSRTVHFTDMINGIIKVPESPEVEAYNSTSMKGIKAANPTAAINLINPPQANNTGNASLSYPLNLPAGRAGMQPQLAISYNSGGGNGWMGLGWNLTVPSISIDTRWGVPRYDPDSETETYTMNGEQLTPVAHRGTLRPRASGGAEGVRFYPRVEGAFNKLVRHGNTPADYWWEVTDKSGTRYFYGATYGGGLDKDAVLGDNEKGDGGNIAYWALREVRDLNGNGVQYHYAKPMDTGLASTSNPDEREEGYQLYIDRITYTDYNGADGKYQIVFTRDREMTAGTFERRQDVMISGNLGFKQVTADLLKKIEVQYEGKNIRHYELNYEKGGTPLNFFKTLLTGISEYDASGALFTAHTFDYYNDVAKGGTLKPLESEDATWNPQDDGIRGDFLNPFDLFNDDASALSGTKSSDSHVGLAVTVGGPGALWSKCNTVGGNFGSGRSKSEGMITMIDINGDGLSDKVYLKDGAFKYRANLFGPGGTMSFGDEITVNGMGTFQREKSKSTNYGLEAIGCLSGGTANIGKSWSKSTSTTSVYFTDANGDQLPDIVNNSVVYFNHLDTLTGAVTFSPSSEGTASPIKQGGNVAGGDPKVDEQALEEARTKNPLHDMVRMWKAPFEGKIRITAPIQILKSGDPVRAENPADGVKASIQHEGAIVGQAVVIRQDDYNVHTFQDVDDIQVNRGDRIFFRLQSVENGSYDSVRWSPVIEYFEKDTEVTDANSKPLYRFSSEEDFLLSGNQEVLVPVPGKVMVAGTFSKPRPPMMFVFAS